MSRRERRMFLTGLARVVCGIAVFLPLVGSLRAQTEPGGILVRGGIVVDGTGAKRRRADVRVRGDRITALGNLTPEPGERVIEAGGKIVAPGFLDTHSHADGDLEKFPDAETQIRQGITTAVVGQDGGENFPLDTYFAALDARPAALNIASFAGHGTIRRQVLGANYKRAATPDEIAKMQALVAQEMQAGALGLSSGLEYDPGHYATTEELIALAQTAAQSRGIYISHVRDEENGAFNSFAEVIRIAREAHLPAQISHIKLASSTVWGKADRVLRLLEDARRAGLDITADVYPYTYWQSTITVLIPTRDWDDRAAWTKGLREVGGAANVRLTAYTPDPTWQGKTLAQLAAASGTDPVSVIQEIVRKTHTGESKERESVVVTAMQESDVARFIAAPPVMFCSDGGLHGTHPRGAGTFPRLLGVYVREKKILSLEAAIHKMTGLPAQRMGFGERGVLKVGNRADIVLFDAATVRDTATVENPTSAPVGLTHVLVNGVPVLDDGKLTAARPGRVLKRENR